MKKKILSLIKSANAKYFIFGVTLSIIISFGVSAVMASGGTFGFLNEESGTLVNRIGSLSIHQGSSASWIDPAQWGTKKGIVREACLTNYGKKDKKETESCLDVDGVGAFSKLTVLHIPAFFTKSLAVRDLLNNNGSGSVFDGIPQGLVIEDFAGEDDDSLMATSLEYKNVSGRLDPRDTTSKRELCARPDTGILYPCGGTQNFSCLNQPQHASRCDSEVLTADTNSTLGDLCSPTIACSFICDTSYHYDSDSNSCILSKCTGTTPAHAVICNGADQNLTTDVPKNLVQNCTNEKCEYVCGAGYHFIKGNCVEDDPVVNGSCDNSVVNGCNAGALNDINDSSTQYLWECIGSGGGTNASCAKDIQQQVQYQWGTDDFGNCISTGTCSGGTYTVNANGTCTGTSEYCVVTYNNNASGYDQDCYEDCYDQYSEADCNDFSGTGGGSCTWNPVKVDWNGDLMDWVEGQEYVVDPSPNTDSGCPNGVNYTNYGGATSPLYTYYVTCSNGNCQWNKKEESVDCDNTGGGCTYRCEVNTTNNISDAYGSSASTYQCSDVTSSSVCTDNGCTWTPNSKQTRDVWCEEVQNGSTSVVANSYCINAGLTSDIDIDNDGIPDTSINGCGICDNTVRNGCIAGIADDAAVQDTSNLYKWRCTGQNGGADSEICQIAKPVDGVCDNSVRNGCIAGISNDAAVQDSGAYYKWRCDGQFGGSNSGICEKAKPSGGGGGGCFVADTLVTMADGNLKNIQDVTAGEKVIGRDGEISTVLKPLQHLASDSFGGNKIYAFNGGRFFVTAEHPFFTIGGWKAIDPIISKEKHPEMSSIAHLKVGDILMTNHGWVLIKSIESKEIDPQTKIYNLMLGGDHTYIADGYVVHNNKGDDSQL